MVTAVTVTDERIRLQECMYTLWWSPLILSIMPLYFSIVALIARKGATISAKGLLIFCPMASKLFRELFGT